MKNCASSWFFLHIYTTMHDSVKEGIHSSIHSFTFF